LQRGVSYINNMIVKLDLHVHSESRGKIYIGHDELRNSLRKNNLDGVAITNFFGIAHALWLKKKLQDYVIIVGQEIWTNDGHMLGLGLKERIDDRQSAEETVAHIHKQGGLAVAPHPHMLLGVGSKVMSLQIDAVESYNAYIGQIVIPNHLAAKSAAKRHLPAIAASDTTSADFVGRSYTEVAVEDRQPILEALRSGKFRLRKKALPLPLIFYFKNFLNFKNVEPWHGHAVPCQICGKALTVRLFPKRFKCIDCGNEFKSRIACCKGHYICMRCVMKRGIKNDGVYQREA